MSVIRSSRFGRSAPRRFSSTRGSSRRPAARSSPDLRTALLALGATHVSVVYAGGSLASVINHLKVTDSLTILPHSVVFAVRTAGEITALPLHLEHPPRALAVLRSGVSPAPASATRFAEHVIAACRELRTLIHEHERALRVE